MAPSSLELYPRDDGDSVPAQEEERLTFIPGSSRSPVLPGSRGSVDLDFENKWIGARLGRGVDSGRDEYGSGTLAGVKRRVREAYQNNVGLLLIAMSQLFASCMNVSVKILNGLDPPVPPFELVAIRMLFTYTFSLGYMYHQKIRHPVLGPPGVRYLLVFRGVSGFFGLFGMYYSLQYLSLSDAVVLTFLTPTVTAIAGHFFLKESFSRGQATAGLLSLVGVLLIARPESIFGAHAVDTPTTAPGVGDGAGVVIGPAERGTPGQRLGAVGVSLLGVFGATGAVTTLRAIGTRAHALHSLTYFSSYSILVSCIGMLVFRIPVVIPLQWQWVILFLVVGLCGYGAQVTLALGLQRETASRGMLAMYLQIVFAAILERIFFKLYPSPLSLLGTAVILTCAIYVALSKKAPQRVSDTNLPRDLEALSVSGPVQDDLELRSRALSMEVKGYEPPGKGVEGARTLS